MAEGPFLLGIDAGNTVIKAVLFDASGGVIASLAVDGSTVHPAPGHVERDMDELWLNAAAVIRGCIETAAVKGSAIAAIGCAGHGNGLYLVDAADRPLIAVQSLDSRAAVLAEELRRDRNGERLRDICRQRPWPSQTPTLLAWLRRNRPDVFARAACLLFCKDVVTLRLTGQRASEISDMSAAGLMRLPCARYDNTLLDGYGLGDARTLLPKLHLPTDIVGTVTLSAAAETGLAAGTPVVAGLIDVVASALGSGAVEPGQASIVMGSWGINQVVADRVVDDPDLFLMSAFAPQRLMALEASATSAANLEWYVREFVERGALHPDPFGFCHKRMGDVNPAPDDPYFQPYLYGSGEDPAMRAAFLGLAGRHREGHLIRAILEGVAFEHRRHIDVLRRAGLDFDEAILSGGGARSDTWSQMLADVLGVPVSVSECEEAGALGAAMAAAVGAGLRPSLDRAVAAMARPDHRRFRPDSSVAAHFEARYQTARRLATAMRPIWSGDI